MTLLAPAPATNVYPDSDGERMADNTLQAEIMVFLKTNFDDLFAANPDVFVAMDLLWYPVQGDNRTRLAPDVMLAFGRPKGYRGSYKQWMENNTPPQVVFEILSPGNRRGEMDRKFDFYQRFGVEEYYIYDPEDFAFSGWQWSAAENRFRLIDPIDGWTSPRLGVRFEAPGDKELKIYRPDGVPFRSPLEIRQALDKEEAERKKAEQERDTAEQERDAAKAEREKLAAKLRELGIDPDTI
jgi:Uma2 family endonuclease